VASSCGPPERAPARRSRKDRRDRPALIAAFDQVDIVALGEAPLWSVDADLRIALIRHPDFAKKVRTFVIECGSIGR
jgi:hypothetical protein